MQASNQPTRIQVPFANTGTKNAIPVASQISITPGAASYTDGFPPLTFTPIVSGGVPPFGADFNGILNAVTAIQQWQSGGGHFTYDATWSTANNGYPRGAVLVAAGAASNSVLWFNTADNNTTDPDSGSAANWVPIGAYNTTAVSGLTNSNLTLTPIQYKNPIISLAGVLTGNIQIIFPLLRREWIVFNSTTGSFTVTAIGATGNGVIIPQGGYIKIFSDGTNVFQVALGNTTAALGTSTDLNLLTTTGAYGVNSSAPNNPAGALSGTLFVTAGPSGVSQMFIRASLNSANHLYFRSYGNTNGWQAWVELAPLDSPVFTTSAQGPTMAQFDSSTNFATTAFLQRALGSLSGFATYSGTTTFTAADVGKLIVASTTATYTLPDATTLPGGSKVIVLTSSSATATVSSTNGAISGPGSNGGSTVTLGSATAMEFVSSGTAWYAYGGSGLASLATNGYQKLPSGLIIQWFTGVTAGGSPNVTKTFPVAFPNNVFAVYATAIFGGAAHYASVETPGLSSVVVRSDVAANIYGFAVGN